jgi:predicted nuclease of predicted toxin-antitoxin system
MRFLLDAHVSGRRVGGPLRGNGHDVRALDQEPELEGLDDEDVLALASEDGRILVTHNVADFPEILREWAGGGRSHAGVILVYGIEHSEFALILRGIERWLDLRPQPEEWLDFSGVVGREFASS